MIVRNIKYRRAKNLFFISRECEQLGEYSPIEKVFSEIKITRLGKGTLELYVKKKKLKKTNNIRFQIFNFQVSHGQFVNFLYV